LDTLERSVSRQVSDSQNLRKDELVDKTRLQIELLDRFDLLSAETGVSGISPNNNFDETLEA